MTFYIITDKVKIFQHYIMQIYADRESRALRRGVPRALRSGAAAGPFEQSDGKKGETPMKPTRDRFRGCLIGGDAVGFCSKAEICVRYGPDGITAYHLDRGAARISDDTQMTLFTANGLLYGATKAALLGVPCSYSDAVFAAYRDWYRTQTGSYPLPDRHWAQSHCCWLLQVPELFQERAPSSTCMSSLAEMIPGSISHPINQSSGCGGIMRVAPVGLYFDDQGQAAMTAAECAALTHGHEMGYIPAAMLAYIVCEASRQEATSLKEIVLGALDAVRTLFREARQMDGFVRLIDRAVALSEQGGSDPAAICRLGAGWVGDESLAIAVYCALRYPDDIDRALIASVNHSGDSDSTGAITGNILGARLGLSGIPRKYLQDLELRDVILEMADDLYEGCPIREDSDLSVSKNRIWYQKYVEIRRGTPQAGPEKKGAV